MLLALSLEQQRFASKRYKTYAWTSRFAVKVLCSVPRHMSSTQKDKGPSGESNRTEGEAPALQRTQRHMRERVLKT